MDERRHDQDTPDNPPVDGPGTGQGTKGVKEDDTEQQGSPSYDSPQGGGDESESASKRREDGS